MLEKTANTSGYVAYEGDGFRLSLPAKWGPSSEREFDGTVLRYVDNAAQANNLTVTVTPTDAKSVREVAPLEKFLEERAFLFGSTSGSYATASEGGFAQDTVQEFDLLEERHPSHGCRDQEGTDLGTRDDRTLCGILFTT